MPTSAVINGRFQSTTSTICTFTNQSVQQVRRKFHQFSTWTRTHWRAQNRNLQKYFRRKTNGGNVSERAANYSTRTTTTNASGGDDRDPSKKNIF